MFLRVKGIGKIQDSTIEMKGITVIAGENNTGKSTFGKILYCLFNTLHNAEDKVYTVRSSDIMRIFQGGLPRFRRNLLGQDSINDILSGHDIQKIVNDVIKSYSPVNPKPDDNIVDMLIENLQRSIAIDKHEIQKILVTRCFEQEFSGKVNHINKPDTPGTVSLEINKNKIAVTIKADECTFLEDNVGLLHDAKYIDTPFILDDVMNGYGSAFAGFYNVMDHRDDLLKCLIKRQSSSTVLEEVIYKQKLNNILAEINSVVGGEFKEDDDSLFFKEQGFKDSVPLTSVSTGIKMFLIVKRLLELGEIKERDILIFDEPEIHLHPDWQIHFAEILVLLQREFNLTILFTTHSPYFLRAIEVYTLRHGINERAKFYLAESEADIANVQDITQSVDGAVQEVNTIFL